MKRFIVLFCIIFNLCFGYKMDIKINKLKQEKQLKIKKRNSLYTKKWIVANVKKRKNTAFNDIKQTK